MRIASQWDPVTFAECVRLMSRLKEVPVAKVLRNAGRDFAHAAYKQTGSAAVRSSPFLEVPNKRGGTYANAFAARQASNARNHGSSIHPEGRHVLKPGMYIRGAMRWVKKTKVKKLGSRGGTTPQPPYPVAKGFARASFIGVFRGLGMTSQRPARNVPPAAMQIGQVSDRAQDARAMLEIMDRLSYIGKLDARDGIVDAGMNAAQQTMERELDREARRMEKLFA